MRLSSEPFKDLNDIRIQDLWALAMSQIDEINLAPDHEPPQDKRPCCPFCFKPITDAVAMETWRQLVESQNQRRALSKAAATEVPPLDLKA